MSTVILRFFHAVTFVMFSFLDLQVEARELVSLKLATNVTMQPKNCLMESSVCSVMTPKKKKYEFIFGKSTVWLDEDTAVLRDSATQITLLKGKIWVKAGENVSVRSEFGSGHSTPGEFWAEKSAKKIVFSPLTGTFTMTPRGSQQTIIVQPNYENWLGPVAKDGVAISGIPQLIDIENHVQRWGKLYSGGKHQFKKDVEEYFTIWYNLVEEASDKNRELALRTIANEAERSKKDAQHQKIIRGEHDRVRDMMLRRLQGE
jgi:hypothetical protein